MWQVWKEGPLNPAASPSRSTGPHPSPSHPGLPFSELSASPCPYPLSDQVGLGLEGGHWGWRVREENPRMTWDDSSIPAPICHLSCFVIYHLSVPSICTSVYNLFVLHPSSSLYTVKQRKLRRKILPAPSVAPIPSSRDFPLPNTDHPTLL